MKKVKLLIPVLCIGLLITGCGNKEIPKLKDGKEVVASLDGKKITADDLYSELKKQGGSTVLLNLIDKFIVDKEITDNKEALEYADSQIATLKAQYESYGESFEDALKNAGYSKEEDFKQVIAQDYKKNKVAENHIKTTITEKEIEKYYENDIYGKMTVRYILVKPDTKDDMTAEEKTKAEKAALDEANEVIKKLEKGEKFEDLAKKHSDDSTTASEGGLYSSFDKKDVVAEFWNASIDLEDGKYTKSPVKSSYGYFIISRVKQDKKPSLKDSKETILTALLNEKIKSDETLTNKAWIEIRKKYNLDIIDSDILSEYNKTIKDIK